MSPTPSPHKQKTENNMETMMMDVSDLTAASRACRARGILRRHDTRTNGQHYTTADRRPTNQVSAWQAEWGSRPTRATPL